VREPLAAVQCPTLNRDALGIHTDSPGNPPDRISGDPRLRWPIETIASGSELRLPGFCRNPQKTGDLGFDDFHDVRQSPQSKPYGESKQRSTVRSDDESGTYEHFLPNRRLALGQEHQRPLGR